MSKENLFKAKRKDNDEWVEGSLLVLDDGCCRIATSCLVGDVENILTVCAYDVDPDTVCQYTGLTDKNGNKIWENDVVQVPREDEYFRIEWDEDTASYVMNSNTLTVTFGNYWSHEVEVIGNIFDNPELLKGSEEE